MGAFSMPDYKEFNVYGQIQKELHEFFNNKIHIAGTKNEEEARYLKKANRNYEFSQWETINLIDLYYNSKFESGEKDSENQRKLFLNICKFRSDVAAKQTDIDLKNFLFVPEEAESEWGAFFIGKEFRYWAKEHQFSELINRCVENFPRYGAVVLKDINGDLEFVPLQTIRNQQDAKSLNDARYVIVEHADMSLDEMKDMKGWKTDSLDMKFGDTATVYERYGFVPRSVIDKANGRETTDDEVVDSLIICTVRPNKKGDPEGTILFAEEIKKRPFIEVHWSNQYGRWLGAGEIENQFENQIGANMSFNLYRRQLLWSSKKIFQSPDDGIAKNLVRDVKDGDVLQISPNGNITQVDMGNRAGADFANFQKILEGNSDQKSFTYEVATGESLPSGTPFRLGVVLSNAVNSHFDLKREKLGLFFKEAILNKVLPTFKRTVTGEHMISMFSDEEGFEALKQTVMNLNLNEAIKHSFLNGRVPDVPALKTRFEQEVGGKNFLFVKIPDSFYDDLAFKLTLTVTGEEIDIPKKIETLTNLYTQLAQRGDPRAERVLKRILGYAGENFDLLAGPAPQTQPQQLPQGQQQPQGQSSSSLSQPTSANQTL